MNCSYSIKFMTEQDVPYVKVSLFPGEAFIAEKPNIVWTLLGSCLAIIFHNKPCQFGAIAHAQLAQDSRMDHQCHAHCPHPCFSDTGEVYLKHHSSRRIVPDEQGKRIDRLPGFLLLGSS